MRWLMLLSVGLIGGLLLASYFKQEEPDTFDKLSKELGIPDGQKRRNATEYYGPSISGDDLLRN